MALLLQFGWFEGAVKSKGEKSFYNLNSWEINNLEVGERLLSPYGKAGTKFAL